MANHENRGNRPSPDQDDLELSKFDADFAEAPVEEREFEPIPDGKYQVNVEKVELTRAQTSGNPLLKWTLRIIAPKCRGRLLCRNNDTATRENLKWLKNDLHVCGLAIQKVSDLPLHLEKLLDVKLEVTKRTRGDSENVYFNRKIVLDPNAGPAEDDRGGYEGRAGEAFGHF